MASYHCSDSLTGTLPVFDAIHIDKCCNIFVEPYNIVLVFSIVGKDGLSGKLDSAWSLLPRLLFCEDFRIQMTQIDPLFSSAEHLKISLAVNVTSDQFLLSYNL